VQTKTRRRARPEGAARRRCRQLVGEAERQRRTGGGAPAEEIYRQAIGIDPRCDEAWAELGCFLVDRGRFSEARDCFRRVLELIRPSARRGVDGGDVQREAIALLAEIAAARPAWAAGRLSLGCAYEALGEYGMARQYLDGATPLDLLREAVAHAVRARMHWAEDKMAEAIGDADRAIHADPANFLAHVVRSVACYSLCRTEEADAGRRRALEIIPNPVIHSAVLFGMNFLAASTPESLYSEARRWNSLYATPFEAEIRPHANLPDPDRRLRIGYVSPDLWNHAIMKFLPPLFERRDRERFEVLVYAVGSRQDDASEWVRRTVDRYVPFQGSTRELAERVRADGVDVLVDLAGHTMAPEILLAFALKPAPVQVTWIGVPMTTGLSTIDYFLGDAHMPYPGTEHLFSETVYRLSQPICYRPFANVPVTPSPCLERGHITFGSFNNPRKITRQAVDLWSAILQAVPESRLLMKSSGLETEIVQQRFLDWFAGNGIRRERLEFAGASRALDYLAAYGAIDIALDPFPYNGGSTTLDTLWMGVPVVTLSGRLAPQCAGACILRTVGLSDMVADTPQQYVQAAVFLAGIVPKIPELRHNVRQAMVASPLRDEIGAVRAAEEAFRSMWRKWCRSQPSAAVLP
jgi:protein O-GlcNAc transferase